jgi:hypothetical protein
MHFLEDFTSYSADCERKIVEELHYEGHLSIMGGSEEICYGVELQTMEKLPAGQFPWRWPWLPKAVWSIASHDSYHKLFRDVAREAVLCLSLRSPLRKLDSSTRSLIVQEIIARAAPTHSTDTATDPWLPKLFAIRPQGLSRREKKRWATDKEDAMRIYLYNIAEGLRRWKTKNRRRA